MGMGTMAHTYKYVLDEQLGPVPLATTLVFIDDNASTTPTVAQICHRFQRSVMVKQPFKYRPVDKTPSS